MLQNINVEDLRIEFKRKLKDEDFVIDKYGGKLLEIAGIAFNPDEETIFGEINNMYANAEIRWYESQSLNVYDIDYKVPMIWTAVADKDGNINSNYGWSIYSKENGEQYKNCLRELKKNKYSRRAMMIYTRPSMQVDYNKNGMNDFICTNTTQLLIRDNELHYIINQRSCDAVYGYKNDLYWHNWVHGKLHIELQHSEYSDLKLGSIHYQIGSLHVYEKHFKFISEEYK